MRVILHHDLFDVQSSAEDALLTRLILSIAADTHQHELLTDPGFNPLGNNGLIDLWLQSTGAVEHVCRDAFLRGLVAATGPRSAAASHAGTPRHWNVPSPLAVRVERIGTTNWAARRLTLHDAMELVAEPVHFVTENARTEIAFFRALAGPTNGAAFSGRLEDAGKITLHGGGGGEAKAWIEGLTEGPQTAAKWRRMLRTWVLFDQDAGDPDARNPSAAALRMMQACEKVDTDFGPGLTWVCLMRREIESYVPDVALTTHQDTQSQALANAVIAWRSNVALQDWAWAVDLKGGLHGDKHSSWQHGLTDTEINETKRGIRALEPRMLKLPFSTLPAPQVTTLSRGFSERLGQALRATATPVWAGDIPREYDRGPTGQAPRATLVQSFFERI